MIGFLKKFFANKARYTVEYATEANGGLAIRLRIGQPITVSRVSSTNGMVHLPWRCGEGGFDENHRIAAALNNGRISESSARTQIIASEYHCDINDDGRMIWSPCDCADISRTVELIHDTSRSSQVGLSTTWRGIMVDTDPGDDAETILKKLKDKPQATKCATCGLDGLTESTNFESRPCKGIR